MTSLVEKFGKPSGLRRGLATTAAANLISVAAAGATGILITRSLGPSERGHYAAVIAWFSVALVIGELGQTAATTYYVASDRNNAARYAATSRNLMISSGLSTVILGIGMAPLLSDGQRTITIAYFIMFSTCVFSYIGASYTFSMQALSTGTWNVIRVFQPLAFSAAVCGLYLTKNLTLVTLVSASSLTILFQTILAYGLCRRIGLTGGSADRKTARLMAKYGVFQMFGAIPVILISRLDQLALSIHESSESLGHYAAATSLTSLVLPVASAIGSVVFPKIALRHGDDSDGLRKLCLVSVVTTVALSTTFAVGLIFTAPWVVPILFGSDYNPAIKLIWILAPGMVAIAGSQVCADLLRGYGHPLIVAKTQWIAAAAAIALMMLLMPPLGAFGAALATVISAYVGFLCTGFKLKQCISSIEKDNPSSAG